MNNQATAYHVLALWDGLALLGPHRLTARADRWIDIQRSEDSRPGDVVLSGIPVSDLVDLHAHFGRGPYALPSDATASAGVRALCSQGDAGPDTYEEWRTATEQISTPSFLALNLAPDGEKLTGCLDHFDDDVVERAVAVARADALRIPMLSVNLSERSLGSADPAMVLRGAITAAERVGVRLMVALAPEHVMPIDVQIDSLRPGDLITYCFRSTPWCLFPTTGAVPALVRAVERGVLLDVAHGSEAFDDEVAARAIRWGFTPDVISSGNKEPEPGYPDPLTLPDVMQKLWALGMELTEVLSAATTTPARLLDLAPTRPFTTGASSDFAVIELAQPLTNSTHQ